MHKISADYIFPVSSRPIKNGLLEVDDSGKILALRTGYDIHTKKDIEIYHGVITPGFINAHCHLELSHLKDQIGPGRGLIDFISNVRVLREEAPAIITGAMGMADREMARNGIVAVGDISNTAISFSIKAHSPIYYHTFIEIYGIGPQEAEGVLENAHHLQGIASAQGLPASITLHAPYSASIKLMEMFYSRILHEKNIVSLHNQESKEEKQMFEERKGGLYSLMLHLGLDNTDWDKAYSGSLGTALKYIAPDQKILLVHNIHTSEQELHEAVRSHPNITWVFCPHSNLHIGGKLPDIPMFVKNKAAIAIGTDGYASNLDLSVLEELKTIHKAYPVLKLEDTILWATLNGARAIGVDKEFGSLDVGKAPGIILIKQVDINNLCLAPESKVEVLFPTG